MITQTKILLRASLHELFPNLQRNSGSFTASIMKLICSFTAVLRSYRSVTVLILFICSSFSNLHAIFIYLDYVISKKISNTFLAIMSFRSFAVHEIDLCDEYLDYCIKLSRQIRQNSMLCSFCTVYSLSIKRNITSLVLERHSLKSTASASAPRWQT